MPISASSNRPNSIDIQSQRSNSFAGVSGASRTSEALPEGSKLLGSQSAHQPFRLTLPPRSSATLLQQSGELQQRVLSEANRQSAMFAPLEERGSESDVQSTHSSIVRRVDSFTSSTSTVLERLPFQDSTAQRKEHARLGLDLNNLRENTEKAKATGVDVAKKTFWSKMAGVAVSALATGVMVGLAVATGGVGLAVAAGIAGLVLARQAADTRCAYKVLQNERAQDQGLQKPHKDVPMGADYVANKMYAVLTKVSPSMSEDSKKSISSKVSTGVSLALTVASVANGGVSAALSGESLLLTVLPAAISVANVGVIFLLNSITAKTQTQTQMHADDQLVYRFIEVNEKYNERLNDSSDPRHMTEQDLMVKTAALLIGLKNLEDDVDMLAQRVEDGVFARQAANTVRTDEEDLAYVKALGNFTQDSELVAAAKNQHQIAEIEAKEAEQLSTQVAKSAAAKEAGVQVAEMVVENAVEKGIEKAAHALGSHADVDVAVMGVFTTLAMIKSAVNLAKAVHELKEVSAPVTKHLDNISQIERQFSYII